MLKIAIWGLRVIYLPIKLFPITDKVTLISRQADRASIDFTLIDDMLRTNYPQLKRVLLAKKLTMSAAGIGSYVFHILCQMYHIATSSVVLLDGYCIAVSVLNHKKKTKVIQLWHALGAIKKFGFQTIGKNSGTDRRLAEIMKMHNNYDYVIASSKPTAQHFCEAFHVAPDRIRYLGMPRIDYLLERSEVASEEIQQFYGIDSGKINVLYLPTFRKNQPVRIGPLIRSIDFSKINLIVKLHPLDQEKLNIEHRAGLIIDDRFSTYDMMKFCDRIVTDYSALGIEAALLEKPLYFYIYDLEAYSADPGLNVSIEQEMGPYAQRSASGLADLLLTEYDPEPAGRFRDKYVSVARDSCTEKICDFIAELMEGNR